MKLQMNRQFFFSDLFSEYGYVDEKERPWFLPKPSRFM